MFVKGRVDGLAPRGRFRVTFDVEIATSVPRGCAGIGGSPGEGVYVKAGAAPVEPQAVAGGGGQVRMNIDKGNQATGGPNALVVGNMANSQRCSPGAGRWELKALGSGAQSLEVEADPRGTLWLIVGTDSGFEGTTAFYLTRVAVTLTPVS